MPTSYSNPGGSGDRRELLIIISDLTFSGGGALTNLEKIFASNSTSTIARFIDGSSPGNDCAFPTIAALNHYISFNFGHPRVIDEATWTQTTTDNHGSWKWQGSNDNSSWSDIGSSFTLGGATSQTQTQLNGNTTAYQWYRLLGVSGNTNNTPFINEITFKIDGAPAQDYSQTLGKGDRSASITVTKSGDLTFTGTLSHLVDGAYAQVEFFGAQTVANKWLQFDLGSSKVVNEARYYYNGSSNTNHGNWKWQGSDNASSWTDIGSSFQWDNAWANDTTTVAVFVFTQLNGNTSAYRYYRLLGVSGNASSNPWLYEFTFSIGDLALDLPETLSDQMNNLSDSLSLINQAAADYGAILEDNLNNWLDGISLVGGDPDFQVFLGDNLQAAFAEGLNLVYSYEEAISDNYDNLSDALGFTVGYPIELFDSNQFNWADFLDFALIGFTTLTLQDDLNNWADFISVLAAAVIISVTLTDQMNNMVDAVSKNIQYRIQLRDIMAMTDQLIARMGHLLTLTDQANNMSDALTSMQYGTQSPFADDMNNMGDSISIALLPADGLTLEISDSMNNMADSWQDSVNPNISLLDYIRAHMNDV